MMRPFGLGLGVLTFGVLLGAMPVFAQQGTTTITNVVFAEGKLVLESQGNLSTAPLTRTQGKVSYTDIPNAVLDLPTGSKFRQENPIPGIASIVVTQEINNFVRVLITGTESLPTVVVTATATGLTFTIPFTAATIPTEEIELTVTGDQNRYRVPSATTATRTDTPLRDVPQSIQVIPRQVLEDQGATRVGDAVRNVSGVSSGNTFGGTRDSFQIRGFTTDAAVFSSIFRDGFRDQNRLIIETSNLERVEVLKGTASILFGPVEPGGIINLVTKRPQVTPSYNFSFGVGSFSQLNPKLDFTGPLDDQGKILYRFNTSHLSATPFRDFRTRISREFAAPIFSFKLGDATDLDLDFSYTRDRRPFDRGLTAQQQGTNLVIPDVPATLIFGEPDDASEVNEISTGYRLEHRFSPNLTFRSAFKYADTNTVADRTETIGFVAPNGDVRRRFRVTTGNLKQYSLQNNLTTSFDIGTVKNKLLFGFDWMGINNNASVRQANTNSLNIFNPQYDAVPRPSRNALPVAADENERADVYTFILQNQIELTSNLKLLIGGNFTTAQQSQTNLINGDVDAQSNSAGIPRVGIIYQPIEPISLYASYSTSFIPSIALTREGTFLPPERGRQFEGGIRAEMGGVTANLAAFQITRTDVATPDTDPQFSVAVGETGSSGVEFDVSGELLPGWNIVASYAYNDARITQDTRSFLIGRQQVGVPFHSGSVWTTYEFKEGSLQGFGVGMGVFLVGDRPNYSITNNPVQMIPGYIRTDAALYYRQKDWNASLNFKNIFNVNYFEGAFAYFNLRGDPFTVQGQVSFNF